MDNHESELWKYSLTKAKSKLKTTENVLQMIIPLKENRLMIKALTFLSESLSLAITSILQKENMGGSSKLSSNQDKNLKLFFSMVNKYINKKDKENIYTLIKIRKEHIKSHLEFIKKDKFVILLGDKYEVITIDLLKNLTNSLKILILKIEGN